jgi:hypothetical protein
MLHDTLEGGGGCPVLERMRHTFGLRVASIVEACSDSIELIRASDGLRQATISPTPADGRGRRDATRRTRGQGQQCPGNRPRPSCGRPGALGSVPGETAREQLRATAALREFFDGRRSGPLTEDLLARGRGVCRAARARSDTGSPRAAGRRHLVPRRDRDTSADRLADRGGRGKQSWHRSRCGRRKLRKSHHALECC